MSANDSLLRPVSWEAPFLEGIVAASLSVGRDLDPKDVFDSMIDAQQSCVTFLQRVSETALDVVERLSPAARANRTIEVTHSISFFDRDDPSTARREDITLSEYAVLLAMSKSNLPTALDQAFPHAPVDSARILDVWNKQAFVIRQRGLSKDNVRLAFPVTAATVAALIEGGNVVSVIRPLTRFQHNPAGKHLN